MNIPLWVSPLIEIPGMAFMCLMLYFLVYHIRRRQADFSTGFYILFTWYLAYTLFQIVFNYFSARFDMYGWFPEFYLHNHVLARISILLLSFIAYYISWQSTLLAANRFVAIALPAVYNSAWWGRRGLWIAVFSNHLSALVATLLKAPVDADYIYVDEGNKTLDLFIGRDDVSVTWIGINTKVTMWIGVVQVFGTFLVELGLIVAIFRYRQRGMLSKSQRNELRLAVFTIFTFTTQLFFYVCTYVQYTNWGPYARGMETIVSVIRVINYWYFDVQSLAPCIGLFWISGHFRNEFLRFYGLRSPHVVSVGASLSRSI